MLRDTLQDTLFCLNSDTERGRCISQVILVCKRKMIEIWSSEILEPMGSNCSLLPVHQKNVTMNSRIWWRGWPCIVLKLLSKSNLISGYVHNKPVQIFRQYGIASHRGIQICLKDTVAIRLGLMCKVLADLKLPISINV